MKYSRVAVLCCLASMVFAGVSFAQDAGIRDTCRYQPVADTWTIASEADSIFSIELWGWIDNPRVFGASLGFNLTTTGPNWEPFIDSLISVDTFIYDIVTVVQTFRRTVLDTAVYQPGSPNNDFFGYNGYLLGFINLYLMDPIFQPDISTKIGDLHVRILEPNRLPETFTLAIDSLFFPPAGAFKYSPFPGTGFPPHFLKAEIEVVNLIGQTTQAVFDPDPAYIYYMFAYDPIMAYVYIGNYDDPYQAGDVNSTTILVNGSISPLASEILMSYPEFTGDVLKLTIPIAPFLEDYGVTYDTTAQLFEVTGEFSDSAPFTREGTVNLIGKYSDNPRRWIVPDDMVLLHGDVNCDALIDIDDVVGIVTFIFGGGGAPKPILIADCDCSNLVDIDDVIYLINFIFDGGSFPCHK